MLIETTELFSQDDYPFGTYVRISNSLSRMSAFLSTALIVGGAIGIAKTYGTVSKMDNTNNRSQPTDVYKNGILSSREISGMACVTPNQGDCLNKTGSLYIADYPDRQKALVLLQKMEGILQSLCRKFKYVVDNIDKQEPQYRLRWANTQGLWSPNQTDLDWQLKHIRSFLSRIQNVSIGEVIRQSHTDFTSYTIEKRDLSMCLRDRKTNQLYADNLITYVFLHELGHIMSPTYGHDDTFVRCFRVMLNMAIYLNLYIEVDYSKQPVDYCGGVYLNSTVWSRT